MKKKKLGAIQLL